MESIFEEFDHLQIEEFQSKVTENAMLEKGGKGKGKKPQKGAGLTSRGATNPDIKCWTCGEQGDYKDKCPKKPKKKTGRNRGKSQEAHTSQPQDDYAFSSHLVGEALARTTVASDAASITIYNSGATAHMFPRRDRFVDFKRIEPKGVKAVNKTVFMATGLGCMKINMPNGKDTTAVTLQDVLYCPDLGYMLISLAKCNAAGFTALLHQGLKWPPDWQNTSISRSILHRRRIFGAYSRI